jgi:4-hydroxyproline epimerase
MNDLPRELEVVDSHTEGEPTRVVVAGWPPPDGATMAERRDSVRRQYDSLRTAVVCEPRGHDAAVGALLTPPVAADSVCGVIFFNNVGYLGMCGHGLMGVVRTLEFLGRLRPGLVRIDTPVGTAGAELHGDGSVTIENVPSHCRARDVALEVAGVGRVVGDVAYGGNWFYLTEYAGCEIALSRVDVLLGFTSRVRDALRTHGVTGDNGSEIDHVEISGPPRRPDADSRTFVLCPGGAFDRSPCGTGTSAKMAALHARGKLRLGELWRQESITGSLFTGWLSQEDNHLIPHIRGHAYVTARSTLHFDPADPLREGFRVG